MPKLAHLLHPAAAPTLAELASGQPCIDSLEALIQCVSGGRAALPMDAEALESLLLEACIAYAPQPTSALVLFQRAPIVIPSGFSSLDGILGGGFRSGEVTELCGPSGAGKTQTCFLCATHVLCGEPLGRRAVFVDTCGSFSASRLASMMEAHVANPDGDDAMVGYTEHVLHDALSRLTVVALHDLSALASWLADFDERHTARPPPTVLFLDSITAAAACVIGGTNAASAHALLGEVGRLLCHIARVHNISVVVTNGTVSDWGSGEGCIMPALGSTWMPVPTVRAWISAAGSACSLLKSAHTLASGVQ